MLHLSQLIREMSARCPGKALPESYLVIDVETSGFNYNPRPGEKRDVVVQLGYAAIQERKLVANNAILLKRPPGTMSQEATDVTGITDEILAAEGTEPAPVYARFVELCELFRMSGCMFAGHNAVSFDVPFITADLRHEGFAFELRPSECIDTGMMIKAAQLGLYPGAYEDLPMFFKRVREIHSRTKWNLSYTIQLLELDRRLGLDLGKAHDAGFDCQMTHYVLEEMRRLGA